ncbi:hypothetical protein [Marinomonas primoryensis]|uniref:Uncharacterized protein n=1 Tax=Marinomonas primoryensis TaxID=178399 RepID=A0ABV0L1Z8_9GAMM
MSTLLTYLIEPKQVFIATTTNLTLTITNPITSPALLFEGGRDPSSIEITIPVGQSADDLSTADTFTASASTTGFSVSKVGDKYQVTSSVSSGTTLNPGQNILVTFTNVSISNTAASTSVTIEEFITSSSATTSVQVNKVQEELGIYAWIDPLTIGESGISTLWWQTTGGETVTIAGSSAQPFPDQFPVTGKPPHTESYIIDAPIGQNAQTTYTLQVFATGKAPQKATATLTKHVPVITSFGLADKTQEGGMNIGPTESNNLFWTSLYATAAYWTGPLGRSQWYTNPVQSQFPPITPGLDVYNASNDKSKLPGTAEYSLTLTGYDPTNKGHNFTTSVTLDIQKVQLAYFKYAKNDNGDLSGIIYKTIPENWPGTHYVVEHDGSAVLTIYQPGGNNSVYYLGSSDTFHPQIQYFAQQENTSTISWVTANLVSLTLNGESVSDIDHGQYEAPSAGVYTLVGSASDGTQVQSVLKVGL